MLGAPETNRTIKVGDDTFRVTKFDSLDGKTIVAYTVEGSEYAIKADRAGMDVNGFRIEGEAALQQFAALIADAWQSHRKLKPKLSTSASGH